MNALAFWQEQEAQKVAKEQEPAVEREGRDSLANSALAFSSKVQAHGLPKHRVEPWHPGVDVSSDDGFFHSA